MDGANTLINNISEPIYLELKQALELGRWQSGRDLSKAQQTIALQALIAYENLNLPEAERSAYIHKPSADTCASKIEEQVVKFKI